MLRNYIKITLRNILNQKLYSGLNVFGLALGLASTLVIFLFVQHELSYDTFHKDADTLYRIIERQPGNVFMGNDRFVVTPASLAGEIKASFPAIEHSTTLNRFSGLLMTGESEFFERGIWADSNFFDVFAFPFIVGDPRTALDDPGKLVLTESMAKKLFNDASPIGESIEIKWWSETFVFEVGGIIKDLPSNTHLTFGFVLPIHANQDYIRNLDEVGQNSYLTYVKLRNGGKPATAAAAIAQQLPAFVDTYVGEENAGRYEYFIEPVADIHLFADANFDIGVPGDIKMVYLFGTIGLLILLLACVNYMNLAVARSMKRAQEVGLRQVIGARRFQIAGQFMCESVFMAFLALGLGLLLMTFFLPIFSELVDRQLFFDWGEPSLMLAMIGLVLFVGLLSGSYPAFYMAQLRPIQTLKGKGGSRRKSVLQQSLIVLQYTVSIALIAGSIIIYQQLQFIQEKEVGYNRDHIVTLPLSGSEVRQHVGTLQTQMRRVPNVEYVTAVSHLPTNIGSSQRVSDWEGRAEGEQMQIYQANVAHDFFDVFQIELATGRRFSPEIASDTVGAVILNETAVRQLGWSSDEALGKRILNDRHVIGVMKDFHLHSLHLPIAPMMVSMSSNWYSQLAVRIKPGQEANTIEKLTAVLSPFTLYPVTYNYLDDIHRDLYESDTKLGKTIGYFAFLAILIASLGLFGLAAYATERRTKEIGVRKVLGATIPNLLTLLSREFLGLVLVSIVLSIPIAYYLMVRWLEDFAYKVDFGAGVFVLTSLLAILIAVLTVSYQAIRAATSDPVKSLRYE